MPREIIFDVDQKGKIHTDYSGFEGQACFTEAAKLKEAMAALGVNLEVTDIDKKKNEIEMRKLPTGVVAGH